MQIILLEKIANLGNLGDVVKVKDGYARNFLIPGKHARRATEAAIKEFEARRADLEKAAAEKLAAAQALRRAAVGQDRAHQPEGRCRRPPVRLGHQRRHRRRPDARWASTIAEVAGAHAQRPAEGDRRARRVGVAAHRRGGRDHRAGGRRSRLTAFFVSTAKAGFDRPSSFVGPRCAMSAHFHSSSTRSSTGLCTGEGPHRGL